MQTTPGSISNQAPRISEMSSLLSSASQPFIRGEDSASFKQALAAIKQDQPPQDTVREEVRKLVATTFITPLFSQMRQGTGFAEGSPFAPGFAENSFNQMFDQLVSDRLIAQMDAPGNRMPLVEQVTQHLMRHQSAASAPAQANAAASKAYSHNTSPKPSTQPSMEIDTHG